MVMSTNTSPAGVSQKQQAIETAISLLLVIGILAWCMQIISPFISITLWAAIIAIATQTPFNKLTSMLGGRKKLAGLAMVLLGVLLVIVPMWSMTTSTLDTAHTLKEKVEAGTLAVPPPREAVKDWPIIGEKTYTQWAAASENLTGFLQEHKEQVKAIGSTVLGNLAGVSLGALQFFISILIAVAFLLNAESIGRGMSLLFNRLAGAQGESFRTLSIATIRSVAVGVLGIAAIQAILAGVGMLAVGVPGAGLWALAVLVVAVAQLPPWLVLGPVIVYVFSVDGSSATSIIFAIWSIAVSFLDMVLKPLFLGRGVDAPMLVILLGAIGGMIVSGIIGLFVGAVVLAFGYMLVVSWLKSGEMESAQAETPAEAESNQ
jgi:predicted PurR-regulated permease PerM